MRKVKVWKEKVNKQLGGELPGENCQEKAIQSVEEVHKELTEADASRANTHRRILHMGF